MKNNDSDIAYATEKTDSSPNGWKEYKLGELGLLQRGRSRHRPRYAFHLYCGNYPFIQTGEIRAAQKYINSYTKTYNELGLQQSRLWPKGTLCITIAANIAELAILSFDACFPDSVLGFIPDSEKSDLNFVFYTLTQFQRELKNIGEGSVQDNINLGTFEEIYFPIPPLPEQKAIAEVLSSLDDKIDLLHRQNKTLEEIAETLFRQRFIEEAEEDWEEKPLSLFIEETIGGEWGKDDCTGEFNIQVNCIRGTDIADLQIGLAARIPVRFIKKSKYDKVSTKHGDIILEISGGTDDQSTGRVIYITKENMELFSYPTIFSNFCRLLRPKDTNYMFFIYLYLRYLYEQNEFFNYENGTSGIKNLDYKFILNDLNFLLPSNNKKIYDFNNEVKDIFYKINKNKQQIITLMKKRDSLLPKLMSGEARVKMAL